MALNIWTAISGGSLGTFAEELPVSINLPLAVSIPTDTTFKVISGSLPGGVYISGHQLIGHPYIVANNTTYSFCIRASNSQGISDRSFTITITGHNVPEFVTGAGDLDIGPGHQLYVLDSTHVNYQIEAFDLNVAVGQTLTYFIGSDDGNLPKGLTLSPDGIISGFIEPVVKITPADGDGSFDNSYFDAVAFDFGSRPTNGFDSYQYDDVFFDYSLVSAPPTTLNANYQFRVTITDGVSFAQRIFKIFVVGTDQFRADNTAYNGVAGGFGSDATYLRAPVWITNSNLGLYRASNYLTIPIMLYDSLDVLFRLETTNQEVYAVTSQASVTDNIASTYITGNITTNSFIITGVPNASAIVVNQSIRGIGIPVGTTILSKTSTTLTLSQKATSTITTAKLYVGGDSLTVTSVKGELATGQYLTFDNYLDGATGTVYQIKSVTDLQVNGLYRLQLYTPLEISIPNGTPFYIGSLSKLPDGIKFDIDAGDIYGQLPYQPAVTKTYKFTITGTRLGDKITDTLSASKTFNITIIGNVNSTIHWNTSGNLGTIPANYTSTLAVSATTTVPDAVVIYELVDGRLPPGLTLNLDGEIIGTTNQYYNASTGALGLTTFDQGGLTFDRNTSTVDRVYVATIQARDQYNYSAITQDFTITVSTPNSVAYSNITTRPYLKSDQRNSWQVFINDSTIFPLDSIYRINDPNFGIQRDLKMLVYAGIQTEAAAAYVGAIGLNIKKKRFQFGHVTKAVAIDPNTLKAVYEVVYVQMIDPMEPNGKHLPLSILENPGIESDRITVDNSVTFYRQSSADLINNAPESRRNIPMVTIDSTGYEVSNPNPDTYYPNSITNWQTRLSQTIDHYDLNGNPISGQSERNYLPLWMRSIPSGKKEQLGYTLSVPLCFCKPGTADTIITNIKFSGFDFSMLDYTVDRFIIDNVTGSQGDKYLVFKDDRITV